MSQNETMKRIFLDTGNEEVMIGTPIHYKLSLTAYFFTRKSISFNSTQDIS